VDIDVDVDVISDADCDVACDVDCDVDGDVDCDADSNVCGDVDCDVDCDVVPIIAVEWIRRALQFLVCLRRLLRVSYCLRPIQTPGHGQRSPDLRTVISVASFIVQVPSIQWTFL